MVFSDTWERWMCDEQWNPPRWIEYAFSSTLMTCLLAILSGIYDIHAVYLIGCLNGVTMIGGLLLEWVHREMRVNEV